MDPALSKEFQFGRLYTAHKILRDNLQTWFNYYGIVRGFRQEMLDLQSSGRMGTTFDDGVAWGQISQAQMVLSILQEALKNMPDYQQYLELRGRQPIPDLPKE